MDIVVFITTLCIALPLLGVLMYVWHKHGKGDTGVMIARVVLLVGVCGILANMLAI